MPGSTRRTIFPRGKLSFFLGHSSIRILLPLITVPTVKFYIASGLSVLILLAKGTTRPSVVPFFSFPTATVERRWFTITAIKVSISGLPVLEELVSQVEALVRCLIRLDLTGGTVREIYRAFATRCARCRCKSSFGRPENNILFNNSPGLASLCI